MSRNRCLIVDRMHPSLPGMLEEIGWEPDYSPDITRDAIRACLHGYQGLIIRSKTRVDHDLIGDNPSLKFVGRAGAGLDNIDVDYLRQKNIAVLHAAEANRDAVGEFTVGLLLGLLRNIPQANDQVRMGIWEREGNRGEELTGKIIGVVGYGNMGQAFVQRVSAFSCKVLAYDKYKKGFGSSICEEVGMERLYEEADVLSLHIPLTTETRGMVNFDYLTRFKKNIVLINTARGEIVPLADLVKALETGKVRGAALDVLENERIHELPSGLQQSLNYLKGKSNVIFTPHIAGWTVESHIKINVVLVDKIKNLIL